MKDWGALDAEKLDLLRKKDKKTDDKTVKAVLQIQAAVEAGGQTITAE